MDNLFLLFFLLTPIAWFIGMVKPTAFSRFSSGNLSRRKITGISLLMFIMSFAGFGMTTDVSPVQDEAVNEPVIEEIIETQLEDVDTADKTEDVQGASVEIIEVSTPTNTVTPSYTITPTPTKFIPASTPTNKPTPTTYIAPTNPPATSNWSCNCSMTCTQISSCAEAYFQLNTCGCSERDGDNDGVPCEKLCK